SISPSTVTTRRPRSISVLRSLVLRRRRSMSTATTIENRPARASSSISAHRVPARRFFVADTALSSRSEEHTSELQSRFDLVCRLLLEKKKKNKYHTHKHDPT